MAVAPRTFLSESMLHIALWQNVALVDVAGDMDVHRMRAVRRAYEVLIADYPEGICSCVFLRTGTPPSSEEARGESASFIRDLGESLNLVAIVIEETGVVGQVLRAIIRGINVLTRNSKLVVFATAEDAIRAVAPRVSEDGLSESASFELARAVRVARGALTARILPAQRAIASA